MLRLLQYMLNLLTDRARPKLPYACSDRMQENVQAQARQATMIQAEAHKIAAEADQLVEDSLAKLVSVLDGILRDTATGKAKWVQQLETIQNMHSTLKTDQEAILERLKLHQEYQAAVLATKMVPVSPGWAEEMEHINNMLERLEARRGLKIEIVEGQPEASADPEDDAGKKK